MKVSLVSHASVVIETDGIRVWTDPWLAGKVFNESWSLFPPPAFDPSILHGIDFVWISHIHPDHFHVPSLNSLPAEFKRRVTILYQDNHAERLFEVLRQCGYRNFRVQHHRQITPLGERSAIYCYSAGTLDSCLGVIGPDATLFNINDARLNATDCRRVRSDLGRVDTVLSQFSLAVYNGFQPRESHLQRGAAGVLDKVLRNHRLLGAKVTIPFASLIRFSMADNRYMNAFANHPRDVWDYAGQRALGVAILFPGDTYDSSIGCDSAAALAKYDAAYATIDQLPYDTPAPVQLPPLEEAFHNMVRHLREKYPRAMLRMLRAVVVRLPDLNKTVAFSIPGDSFVEVEPSRRSDLVMSSQPLHLCFSKPYGLQTLASSAQHSVVRHRANWRIHRALFALNNAEAYGRLKYLLSLNTWRYFAKRGRAAVRYTDLTTARIKLPRLQGPKRRAN